MSMKLLAILVLALVPLALTASIPSNDYVSAMSSLDDKLLSYDKRIRPGVGENAVNVTASMYIIRAYDYNEKTHVSSFQSPLKLLFILTTCFSYFSPLT